MRLSQSSQQRLPLASVDPAGAIAEFEQILVSNSGEDPFGTAIRLLAAKLVDEVENPTSERPAFQTHKSAESTCNLIQELWGRAVLRWPQLNGATEALDISPQHLIRAMQPLVGWRLLGSDLSTLDATLERLVARDSKGELGQYFTPREVIRFCVEVLNPGPNDRLIDPACGSGGFLFEAALHSIKRHSTGPSCLGIDFGARAIKVAALLAAATPHADIQVSRANSIDGRAYGSSTPPEWKRFLSKEGGSQSRRARLWGDWNKLRCSVVLTNPPFAGDIDDFEILDAFESQQTLGARKSTSREHLFLERAVHLLNPGGRLAIVLPQGVLANPSSAYLRSWLIDKCRLLGVVGLQPSAFLPYTSVKTSLLFLLKPGPKEAVTRDYSVFFAASRCSGKDSSGRVIGDSDYGEISTSFCRFLARERFRWASQATVSLQGVQGESVPLAEVLQAERLDAEYYNPSARALVKGLDATTGERLVSVVDSKIDRFKRGSGGQISYFDISSVDGKTGLAFPNSIQADEAPSRASYVVQPGDVLVSTVRPERNAVALVTESPGNQAVASNGFCVLRPRSVEPELLFAYCKTEAFRAILSRHATASMYPTVTDRDVLRVAFLRPSSKLTAHVVKLIKSGLQGIKRAHQQIEEAVGLMNRHIESREIHQRDGKQRRLKTKTLMERTQLRA